MKDKIIQFIKDGEDIRKTEYHDNFESGIIMLPYISGPKYDMWMNKIKVFATRNLQSYPLYSEIIDTCDRRNNQWGTTAYDNMMSYLRTLLEEGFTEVGDVPTTMHHEEGEKKIFISHSSLDKEYVEPFINLLESIGFAGRGLIFCSSISGYDIPIGINIYDYLKQQFDKDLIVILILSDNYYSSSASLNEMGAAWITSKDQMAVLLPEFEYSQINGAIDPLKIWIKINDKDRLTELKELLLKKFGLPEIESGVWERIRDSYLNKMLILEDKYRYRRSKQKAELETIVNNSGSIICVFRFINEGLTPVVCSELVLKLLDDTGRSATIKLSYGYIKNYKVHGKERKRIVIEIPNDSIEKDEYFNFNTYGNWTISTSWSTYTD